MALYAISVTLVCIVGVKAARCRIENHIFQPAAEGSSVNKGNSLLGLDAPTSLPDIGRVAN